MPDKGYVVKVKRSDGTVLDVVVTASNMTNAKTVVRQDSYLGPKIKSREYSIKSVKQRKGFTDWA